MAYCWQARGCDEEMSSRCPHNVKGVFSPCPIDCCYTACENPQHEVAEPAVALASDVDRRAAAKEQCMWCTFFLKTGPRLVHSSADSK